jgi:Protein of unknown function (DUF3800)
MAHLAYIDDSRDTTTSVFCAIIIPVADWLRIADELLQFRRQLRKKYGIYVAAELHASDFLAGKGHLGAALTEPQRAAIFGEVLDFVASRAPLEVLPACGPRPDEDKLFERLVDRLNVNARKKRSHMIIVSDEGKDYTGMVRRMRRYNVITSKYGAWPDGSPWQNMPLKHIVEDIVFRDSRRSALIQLADFCAFSLLRNQKPTPRITRMGLDQAFLRLHPVLIPQAFAKDPRKLGIIRAA